MSDVHRNRIPMIIFCVLVETAAVLHAISPFYVNLNYFVLTYAYILLKLSSFVSEAWFGKRRVKNGS